jgi:SAM-dependent methyltransferase
MPDQPARNPDRVRKATPDRPIDNPDCVREAVRERYAAAARRVDSQPAGAASCCASPGAGASSCCSSQEAALHEDQRIGDPRGSRATSGSVWGAELYPPTARGELPETAVLASLGCGNPVAVAELNPGETVLDLGSGGGIDVLLSARRVGPTGRAYGLDMTDEMLALARENQTKAGVENVEWLRGHIEQVPLPDASVDVVISNCVINLSADKPAALREAARVLRPGGRFAVTDVIADPDMDAATRADMAQLTGCVAGALTRDEYARHLRAAGLADVEIEETHRVHPHAASAVVRARRPGPR